MSNSRSVLIRFSSARRLNAATEVRLDFVRGRVWELMPDALAGQIARQFVQLQGNPQPILARHETISLDLT
jgi:hypothetical protein